MNKDNTMKKSRKINAEKKGARKPRLSKEEREARKLKLQEERAAKKAARLAKREAKKQKEAERKAAAKAKREERKAKKAARLQAEKERKAARKLKAKERAEAKKAREAARLEKKAARAKKVRKSGTKIITMVPRPVGKKAKIAEVKKVSVQEKIEAERNEWKALSAIRRYVKSNAKILEELDGDKLARKIKKLQKMGYTIDVKNGAPISIGYDFEIGVRIKAEKPAPEKKERKPRKPRAEKTDEVQQPQDSAVVVEPEELPADAEEKLLTDDEILEAAKQDTEAQSVEVLAGDTFKDETEIAEDDSLKNPDNDDEELDEDDDDEDDDEDDDIIGRDGDISDEQADYRREAFREMEGNGTWD